jgi:3'-phosphoadenosine 5'-phosphosulfate (PAPS) 3'-phosphatase
VPGFKKWDMCGSEAILMSRFGVVSDAARRPLNYSSEGSYTMKDGILAAKSKQILNICEERVFRQTGYGFAHFNFMISS